MSLAWEKFSAAVQSLTGPGHQRERLSTACVEHLLSLRSKELPTEIKNDFEMLTEAILGHSKDCGKIRSAIASADDMQVMAMVLLILRMYAVLVQYQPFPIQANAAQR
ncbi:MAG: hypothetical protein HYS18_12380 [Burkholderiales bacterium]|nr:hypothetical protein [Burkholderiales bacterium]